MAKDDTSRQALAQNKFVPHSTSTLMVMCCPDTHNVFTAPPGVILSTTQVGIRVYSCHGNLPVGLLKAKSFCPEFTTKIPRQSAIRLACACSVTRFKTTLHTQAICDLLSRGLLVQRQIALYASSFAHMSPEKTNWSKLKTCPAVLDLTCGSYLSNNCQTRSPSADPAFTTRSRARPEVLCRSKW